MSSMIDGEGPEGLEAHVTWPWLGRVAGVTPPAAARLLSRLDPSRASTPSAFWAYCGLSTVPRPGGGRTAQPSRPNDETKRLCHSLGVSLLRANGSYARLYRDELTALAGTRPDWPPERRHLTALRKMEKQFLAHLWLVWREALGMPVTRPHEEDRAASPWDMVGAPRRRWLSNPPSRPGPFRG